jgi:tetratricopeptide (TPR) repeat protein
MTISLSLPRQSPASRLAPGLLLTAGIVVAAFTLRQVPALSMFSPLILAVVLGVGLRNALGLPAAALPGMQFALRRLLRLGIVTLGLQLTLSQIAEVGLTGVAIIVTGLCATFGFTTLAGRALGVPANLTRLIATGTSVCGASAVLAAHAIGGKSDEDVAYAIACVTLFGNAAMLVFPLLGQGLDPRAYGLWTGASIHEVAQVVAAGAQHGPDAAAFAADMPRILACSLLAANLSERAGKPVPYALAVMGYSASYLGMARLAERYFGRASAAARVQDDPTALVEATQMECAYLLGAGAFERCKQLLDDGYAAAERADYQLGLALSEGFAGQCEFHLGNFESMLAHYCRAQELLTVSTPEHEHSLLCGQALALCMLGRFDEAELLLADGAARVGAQYLLGEAFVQAIRCYAWAWGGDSGRARDGALATNRYVAEHAIAIPPPCGHVLAGPAEALLAAVRVDPDPKLVEAARTHARAMATWARKHPVGEAPALLFSAQLDLALGERERASDGLEQALVAAKRLALRFVQAQAELELGRLRGASTEPGRGHLERALDLALRCGAAHHARAARRALDAVHVDAGAPDRVTRAPGG